MANPVKIITAESLTNKANEIIIVRDKINSMRKNKCITVNDHIIQKYLELQNVASVTEYLNIQGLRIKDRKYTPSDIVGCICSPDSDVKSLPQYRMAKAIFSYNKGQCFWPAIVKLCKEI
jgi:hypothetical protein